MVWGLEYLFVTEAVAQNLLQRYGITAVQLKDENRNGDKYTRVKMKITVVVGILRLPVVCLNCGRLGPDLPCPVPPGDLSYGLHQQLLR